MMVANGLKLLGAGCICFGVNPFIGYAGGDWRRLFAAMPHSANSPPACEG